MIQTLRSNAFAGALTAPKSQGINPLFRAKIRIGKASVHCYVKPQPDSIRCPATRDIVQNQELPSEALGYVLAKSCGFEVPAAAGIILLQANQIPENTLACLRGISPDGVQEDYLCWFSQDMAYPNLLEKHLDGINIPFLQQRRLKRIAAELAKSEDTASIVAFDDWLVNSDRHPGNLLSVAGGKMMLIDHGRILAYPNWKPGNLGVLGSGMVLENRLSTFLDKHETAWSQKLPNKSKILMAYQAFAMSFRAHGESAAREALAHLFDVAEIDAILHLLRNQHDSRAYAKSHGMVI